MRTTFALSALVASCVAGLAALPGPSAQRPFRSGVDMVTFGVTVVDRKGRTLTDLGAGDFEVYEDGTKQSVQLFVPCDAERGQAGPGSPVDLHLGALLDISGSMEQSLQFERTAAVKFLDSRPEAKDFTLVEFETGVRVSTYTQSEFGRLVERIRSRRAEGDTALWDATGVYLHAASQQEGRKVLVLYTDGGDNASSLPFADLLDLLKASDVTVHAIGLVQHQPVAVMLDLRTRLQRIAEITGGQAFFPVTSRDLDRAYEQVAGEIDAQYLLGYVSANTKTDGAWRKVEIRVTKPGLSGVKVRARQGYFAPKRPFAPAPEA